MAFDPKEFLQGESVTTSAETKFDPKEFLKEDTVETEFLQPSAQGSDLAAGVAQSLAPIAPQLVPGPTGINPREIAGAIKPLGQAAMNIGGGYVRHPLEAIADLGAMHMGLPPPIASLKTIGGIKDVLSGANESLNNINFKLNALNEVGPEIRGAFNNIVDKLPKNIIDDISARGAAALKSAQLPEHLLNDAKFMESWNMLKGQVPTLAEKTGKILGPLARGAMKIAGPAGLALNAYDAANYAQDAQLGQRLAQGQGQLAQHNFRQMNPGYGAPITPDQAAAVQQNGSQRDIDALIRQKAAQKVLAPIAPGQ